MDREREEAHALPTETHTQNMGQDNNSPAEKVHNTVSGILGQWIEKEKKHMHFQQKRTLKTWDKTTTHRLRKYIMRSVKFKSRDKEKEETHALSTETHTQNMGQDNNSQTENVHNRVRRILGQWIEKEKKHMDFQQKHTLKTWDKTTTHHLRMYIIR